MAEGFNATQRELEILELRKENERLRKALAPFAVSRLPSSRKTELDYNLHGLRCIMSPMDIARRDATRALSSEEHS